MLFARRIIPFSACLFYFLLNAIEEKKTKIKNGGRIKLARKRDERMKAKIVPDGVSSFLEFSDFSFDR
jgi:hypothetical protein